MKEAASKLKVPGFEPLGRLSDRQSINGSRSEKWQESTTKDFVVFKIFAPERAVVVDPRWREIDSPRILPVKDVLDVEGTTIIVSDWLPGESTVSGTLDPTIATQAIADILRALRYLHGIKQIAHGNLRPSNVFIGEGHAFLGDYAHLPVTTDFAGDLSQFRMLAELLAAERQLPAFDSLLTAGSVEDAYRAGAAAKWELLEGGDGDAVLDSELAADADARLTHVQLERRCAALRARVAELEADRGDLEKKVVEAEKRMSPVHSADDVNSSILRSPVKVPQIPRQASAESPESPTVDVDIRSPPKPPPFEGQTPFYGQGMHPSMSQSVRMDRKSVAPSYVAPILSSQISKSMSRKSMSSFGGPGQIQSPQSARKVSNVESFQMAVKSPPIPISLIHKAAREGDCDEIRRCIREDPNCVNQNYSGFCPIHLALMHKQVKAVRLLLKHGADARQRDPHQRTTLHMAIGTGQRALIGPLLKAGAGIDDQDGNGQTPLHFALTQRDAESAAMLVQAGAGLEVKTRVKAKSAKLGDGSTPLIAASRLDQFSDTVKALIERGADVTATNEHGWTALHVAAFSGASENADLLLEAGADPKARTKDGQLPADLANDRRRGALAERLQALARQGS